MKVKSKYDFSGWATKNDIRCDDGVIIRKDAFIEQSGDRVALVWGHNHEDPEYVLGYADLENRDEGMFCHCAFNNSKKAKVAKELVSHGDLNSLSIHANKLTKRGSEVLHGTIREVSLVLSGANSGAKIEYPSFQHSAFDYIDFDDVDEMIIHSGVSIEMLDDIDDEPEDEVETEAEVEDSEEEKEMTVKEVYDGMTDQQKEAVSTIVEAVLEEALSEEEEEADETDEEIEEDENMKHNVFDVEYETSDESISHDALNEMLANAKEHNVSSARKDFIEHAGDYGINNIEILFPDARAITDTPDFIKREDAWVSTVIQGTKHSPFSRIKTNVANITADEARARGYVRGTKKIDEVIEVFNRDVSPQTIYKKQKLDRDDIIDITDFNVVAWLKQEMRMMLDEEIARAILVGDGRNPSAQDKIKEDKVIPIATDEDEFAIKVPVDFTGATTDEDKANAIIKAIIKGRIQYRGSGEPIFFTTEETLTNMLLIEDKMGRAIYNDVNAIATKLRVSRIVTVPVMEGLQRTDKNTSKKYDLLGVIVNLKDYTVGADKGGAVSMFEDFDIDFNQEKYLIETRISGMLTKPYSALVIETEVSGSTPTPNP